MLRRLFFVIICIGVSLEFTYAKANKTSADLKKLAKYYISQKAEGLLPEDSICAAAMYYTIKKHDWYTAEKAYNDLQIHRRRLMGSEYPSAFDMYLSICVEQLKLTVSEDDIRMYLNMREAMAKGNKRIFGRAIFDTGMSIQRLGDEEFTTELLELFLKYEAEMEPVYFNRYLMDIGWIYNSYQMPQKAYMLFKKCADYYLTTMGEYSMNYAKSISAMAYVSRFVGKEKDRMPLFLKQKAILEHNGDTISDKYAVCLDNLAMTFHSNDESHKAVKYAEKARTLFESNDHTADLSVTLNNLAAIYRKLSLKDSLYLEKAENLLHQSIKLQPTAEAVMNLIDFYDAQKKEHDKAARLIDAFPGEYQHSVYANEIAAHYASMGDFETYTKYMQEYLDYKKTVLQTNAVYMSKEERDDYVKFFQDENLEELFDNAAHSRSSNMSTLCYNYLLMSRSLLLSFDASIKNIMAQTKNAELRNMYLTYLVQKKDYESGHLSKEQYNQYEHEFLESLSKERNFTDFTNLKMEDVQNRLGNDDLVIEFYENPAHHSPTLYAVVLEHKKIPEVIACCSAEKEQTYADNNKLTELVYDKLSQYISNKKNIYFVPCGRMYTYPFESEINQYCSESTKFFRLSSSRELVLDKQKKGKNAIIYGGLQYGMGIDKMTADSLEYSKKESSFEFSAPTRFADQIIPLPGTLEEAKNIKLTFDKNGKEKAELFVDLKGTESAFKANNGKNIRIIHIGTHGFYIKDNIEMNDPLLKSGLLMSGAENHFYEENFINGANDGILTSLEISNINLQGLDLVTLSACETAKGDITGDGVFGLQRGFKKAGANSILMSLWKVDDEATCKLMTEFYSNWIAKKMTKHDALEAAKKAVRTDKKHPQWQGPQYWASFILLDGLD